jgi:hypothetical protein
MKKIGFIDYFLDEAHANGFPSLIRENCQSVGRDIDVTYAWAQTSKPNGVDTQTWCANHNVTELSSIAEVVEKSDYLVILSPDNQEYHEAYSDLALRSGKPTYIDKTFSPDLRSGVRMFDLAEKYNTPMFSASALRDSKELAEYLDDPAVRPTLEYIATSGPGIYANYAVHQFEMIVALLGPGASRVKSLSSAHGGFLSVEYPDERKASWLQMGASPFQMLIQFKNGESHYIPKCGDYFLRQINALLNFFESGKPPVPKEETLEIMALIEAGRKAIANYDTWVTVEKA